MDQFLVLDLDFLAPFGTWYSRVPNKRKFSSLQCLLDTQKTFSTDFRISKIIVRDSRVSKIGKQNII